MPEKLLMNVSKLKRKDYFELPWGDDYRVPCDIMQQGDKKILKELIYQGALQLFKENNKIDDFGISIVMNHFNFTKYDDLDIRKHPNTKIHYVKGISVLVNEGENEYFEQIELAAHDFRKKIKYKTVIDEIIDDLKTAISNKHDELGSAFFANKHFSSENIQLEIRHESFETNGYYNCVKKLEEMFADINEHQYCQTKIRFIGYKMRPFGLVFNEKKEKKETFSKGASRQEENRCGLYVIVRHGMKYIFLFDLDDDNKINQLTIIRGYATNLYNFVDEETDPLL